MEYLTIIQCAKRGPVTEYMLRKWLSDGELPGFFAGTRFYVNYPALLAKVGATQNKI